MDEKKIIGALQEKYAVSLNVTADYINTLSVAATPIWRGNLRRSKRVRKVSWAEVEAITGDEKTSAYVAKQYYANLRHKGEPKSGYESFSTGFANGGGMGESAQYQRGYRAQRGLVGRSQAKWYHRVIEDKEMMRRVKSVMSNSFKAAK